MTDVPAAPGADDRGTRAALMFALVAERLSAYYEHGQWMTDAQGASLSADWLARSKRSMPLPHRRALSALSDDLAREIAAAVSREAGLYTAHEMMESLDPNYQSEVGRSLMAECERLVDAHEATRHVDGRQ
jgi:hypothetical protein